MCLTGFLFGTTNSAIEGLASSNELIMPKRNAIGSTSLPPTHIIPATSANTKNTPPNTLKACAYSLIHRAMLIAGLYSLMFVIFIFAHW